MKSDDELRDDAAVSLMPLYLQLCTRQVQTIAGMPPKVEIDTMGAAAGAYQSAQALVQMRRQMLNNLAAAEAKKAEKEARYGGNANGANGKPALIVGG